MLVEIQGVVEGLHPVLPAPFVSTLLLLIIPKIGQDEEVNVDHHYAEQSRPFVLLCLAELEVGRSHLRPLLLDIFLDAKNKAMKPRLKLPDYVKSLIGELFHDFRLKSEHHL